MSDQPAQRPADRSDQGARRAGRSAHAKECRGIRGRRGHGQGARSHREVQSRVSLPWPPVARFGVREAARSSSTGANRTLPEGGAKMMFIQSIRGSVIVFKSTRMRIRSLPIGQEKKRQDRSLDAPQRRLAAFIRALPNQGEDP